MVAEVLCHRITAWVDRVQRPVVSKLSAESEGEFESIDETVLIAYIPPSDAASRAAFEEVALRYYHEFTFGILDVPEHQWSQRDGMPNVKCYRPLDKDMKVHSGPLAIESLEMFVKEASVRKEAPRAVQLILKLTTAFSARSLVSYCLATTSGSST